MCGRSQLPELINLVRRGQSPTHLAHERRVAEARIMQALDHMSPWLLPALRKVHEIGEGHLVGERRGGRGRGLRGGDEEIFIAHVER